MASYNLQEVHVGVPNCWKNVSSYTIGSSILTLFPLCNIGDNFTLTRLRRPLSALYFLHKVLGFINRSVLSVILIDMT